MSRMPPEEIAKLMDFVAEKARNAYTRLSATQLSEQFIEATGSLWTRGGLRNRIRAQGTRIHTMDQFDEEMKVRLMFVLSVQVDPEFLIQLRKEADVEVDERGRIIRYEKRGGGLYLEGIHKKIKDIDTSLDDSALSLPTVHAASPSTSIGAQKKQNKERNTRNPVTTRRKRARRTSPEVVEHEEREDSVWSDVEENPEDGDDFGFEIPVEERDQEDEEDVIDAEEEILLEQNFDGILMEPKAEAEAIEIRLDPSEDTHANVKELLILLRGAVLSVESASLASLVEKMKLKIQKSGEQNKRFALENINIPFDACLFLLTSNAEHKSAPNQEFISLRDFLISLKSVTAHINHQSIYGFHQRLRTLIFELSARDKKISVETVQHAIEATLIIIAP